jgi:hypothetical protein
MQLSTVSGPTVLSQLSCHPPIELCQFVAQQLAPWYGVLGRSGDSQQVRPASLEDPSVLGVQIYTVAVRDDHLPREHLPRISQTTPSPRLGRSTRSVSVAVVNVHNHHRWPPTR